MLLGRVSITTNAERFVILTFNRRIAAAFDYRFGAIDDAQSELSKCFENLL